MGAAGTFFDRKIERVVITTGYEVHSIDEVPCGNVCGLFCVDQLLKANTTISTNRNAKQIKIEHHTFEGLIKNRYASLFFLFASLALIVAIISFFVGYRKISVIPFLLFVILLSTFIYKKKLHEKCC